MAPANLPASAKGGGARKRDCGGEGARVGEDSDDGALCIWEAPLLDGGGAGGGPRLVLPPVDCGESSLTRVVKAPGGGGGGALAFRSSSAACVALFCSR